MNSGNPLIHEKTIWAFDLGKASIGEAVRLNDTFLHKASFLIPAEFAETKTAASRRRMWRTRIAHQERERWLGEVMLKAGIEPLIGRQTIKIDGKWQATVETEVQKLSRHRLEREFAAPGDPTCYTSSLLRIKLLLGEQLEAWQVYKAFHSAIQRRGYDANIPWKTRSQSKAKPGNAEDDEAGTQARMEEFIRQLEEMAPGKPVFHFPCYFEAWKMGLWDPAKPTQLKDRISCRAESTRNHIVPRKLVEKEIAALMEGAAKHYPQLKGLTKYLLYGPSETAYASYDAKLRRQYDLKEGGANDWQGVVGQKIPRFDNRIIGKCVLIPRMNVCKVRTDSKGAIHPQSKLAAEVAFLMKLKNMRIQRAGKSTSLSAKEIKAIIENPAFNNLAITEAAWKKKICAPLLAVALPGHESVEAPKISGRSRFCRPALDILKRLILSGESPKHFYDAEVAELKGNTNLLKGLVKDDLKFLLRMGETWEGIYIPNQRLDALVRSAESPDKAVRSLIGLQNDPIVRHRLSVFAERLTVFTAKFGEPESVVLEFVREDFMGRKAKLEYNKFIRDRATDRARAKKEAAEAGNSERAAGFKLELLNAQKGICLYTGDGLIPTELDQYVIDHVVPRAKGGPDAALNYVLTTRRTNDDKSNRTPYEWLSTTNGWDAYVNRVRERLTTLRHKKAQLLLSPIAETLVEKYTALAETAWISKLAQAILDLHFGWRNGTDMKGQKRVVIISGGLTGRIRRKYGLNRILNPDAEDEEEAEKKNRNDDRHHALDAMVISFIPTWARDPKKTGFFRFPENVNRQFFEREIKDVIPENICFEKAVLAETIYGARYSGERRIIVRRTEVITLAQKPVGPSKTKFDLEYAKKQIQTIRDFHIQQQLANFVSTGPTETMWNDFCRNFYLRRKNGLPGSAIRFVRVNVGDADEYKDMSKDGSGAFRRALKGHKGQFIYFDSKRKPKVRPVYAFESAPRVRIELIQNVGATAMVGFFQSGCLVELEKSISHNSTPLIPGKYKLNTILTDGRAKVTDSSGKMSLPISLEKMLAAGFKRVS
ncbi:MAG TPA: HNH endonuclease domain-containing protein [Verrucomicrobiae bacterium]|jgi:CRISPR-associated endonuclease Csn1|nr:HNH endonuclease domain-containing protein [Verrucomicrobiae bacterium]